MSRAKSVVRLSEMTPEQEGDLFVLMTLKEEHTTREGKRYFKVGFRDAEREVVFPVWDNSPFAAPCRDEWTPGRFYKLRAVYRQTPYGPQLDLRKVRETCPADAQDGFDPLMCLPRSRFDAAAMCAELCQLGARHIPPGPLRRLVEELLETHKDRLVLHPAGRHHHAFCGGLLEHTLSMTRCCAMLADEFAAKYPDLQPPLDKPLVVAGAVLHDLGKLEELAWQPTETAWTPAGALLGHVLLGRDMVRQAAARVHLEPGRDADDFFFVTDPGWFDRLAALGFNVVLQDNTGVTDDGSLSVLAGRLGIPYVNVEAQHGHVKTQRRMLEALVRQINPGAGPR